MNFLKETKEAINDSGHTEHDVMFIGSNDGKYRISMDAFERIADFEYDSGFGSSKIATDLIIYFKDNSYIARGEYDGSEWWEYNVPLTYSEVDKSLPIKKMNSHMWSDVATLNGVKE